MLAYFFIQVTLVGLVRAVKETPTRLDYEIDDLSGPPLEVKQFVDNDVSIRIYHKCECRIEKSVARIAVWHNKACQQLSSTLVRSQDFS